MVATARRGHGSWRKFFSNLEIPERVCVHVCVAEGEIDTKNGSVHAVSLVQMPGD